MSIKSLVFAPIQC